MAGDWIKMRSNLWDDPRVARIVELTGHSEAEVVGGLYWLWATADQHSTDGVLVGMTLQTIQRKTGLPGNGELDRISFPAALVEVDWIVVEPGGLRIPRFADHNGASAKRRATEAVRKAKSRSKDPEPEPEPAPEPTTKTKAGPDCPADRILAEFNHAFGRSDRMTDKRRTSLRERWRRPAWRDNYAQAIDTGAESEFLRGGGSTGWAANFEWFIKPDSVDQILEGKYDTVKGTKTNGEHREQSNANAFESVRQQAAAVSIPARGNQSGKADSGPRTTLFIENAGHVHPAPN